LGSNECIIVSKDCQKNLKMNFVFVLQGAATATLFQDAWITLSLKDLDSWQVISSSELSWLQLTSEVI
jgi:hypothetical protein